MDALTLTLAGITGAIVAIGITADSFVVYFERLRDVLRHLVLDGKDVVHRTVEAAGPDRVSRTRLHELRGDADAVAQSPEDIQQQYGKKIGAKLAAAFRAKGDIVRIEGALRRRFWKTPSGVASRTEVEASLLTRA